MQGIKIRREKKTHLFFLSGKMGVYDHSSRKRKRLDEGVATLPRLRRGENVKACLRERTPRLYPAK